MFTDHDYSCNFVTQRAEENIFDFENSFKALLTKNISPLRISSMTFNFQSDKISSTVEFLEKPELESKSIVQMIFFPSIHYANVFQFYIRIVQEARYPAQGGKQSVCTF